MENLKFKYKCHECDREVNMNYKDVINFILDNKDDYGDRDNLYSFFSSEGMKYNLCPECARQEGFDVEDFEGDEE